MAQQAARESRPEASQKKRIPLKIELCLEMLVQADREGRYVMEFHARDSYGDSCFHTTVSTLRDKGIEFLQKPYKHTHRHGGVSRYQQYRLTPGSRQKAEALLLEYQLLTSRRGAA